MWKWAPIVITVIGCRNLVVKNHSYLDSKENAMFIVFLIIFHFLDNRHTR
jgi:hypothetical protein